MNYSIINHLDDNHFNMLRKLRGKVLKNLIIENIGEYALTVILTLETECIKIRNTPVMQVDGDEYPSLVVEEMIGKIDDCTTLNVGREIKSISIVRDRLKWESNDKEWLVESDIAIKLSLREYNLLLISHDSLAGFMKLVKISESPLTNNIFNGYWSMKTDVINFIERTEIPVI